MKRVFWAMGFLGLLVCLYVTQGAADTKSTTLAVQGTVVAPAINVVATPVDFGVLSRTDPTRAEGGIEVEAQTGLVYRISLDAGVNNQGTSRLLKCPDNPGIILEYQLFSDSAETVKWGDAGYGDTYPSGQPLGPLTGDGTKQQYPVYADVQFTGSAPVGQYVDTITVTVHY